MITEDLVSYIQSQVKKNIQKDMIVFRLTQAGWREEDIEEAFAKINGPIATTISTPVITAMSTPPITSEPPAIEAPKVWIPKSNKPGFSSISNVPEVQPLEIPSQNLNIGTINPNPVIVEEPKIWIPKSLDSSLDSKKIFTPEIQPVEIPAQNIASGVKPETIKIQEPVTVSQQSNPPIMQEPSFLEKKISDPVASSLSVSPAMSTVSLIPDLTNEPLIPKEVSPSVASSVWQTTVPSEPSTLAKAQAETFSNKAMISSYQQDSLSANKVEEQFQKPNKNFKKILVILLIVLVASGGVFAFMNGYIKIPTSLIKKDPKSLVLNGAFSLKNLKSYKSQTEINISIPSFANITNGLVSGDSVRSIDVESVSLTTNGQVINGGLMTPTLYSYKGTIKSSLLKNEITSSVVYNGSTSYVQIPRLNELLGVDAPAETTVAIANGQFGLIIPELSMNMQKLIKKVDVYEIIPKGMPTFVKEDSVTAVRDFISNTTVIEKENENIKGTDTYHYSLQAQGAVTKKMLTDLLDIFVISLSPEMKANVDEGLGAVKLDSFDIWIGKNDNKVHQYQFVFSAPLSKVIALDDKGIAGKQVSISFKNTLYDFDVVNSIILPTQAISMPDFVKNVRDNKIKNIITAFVPAAKSLSNAEGGYGKKTNIVGSCVNPTAGSLFSPLGHIKGADSQVSSIAHLMNEFLISTNGLGSCYSSSSAWAISSPMQSDPATHYCADSTGNTMILSSSISGTICK